MPIIACVLIGIGTIFIYIPVLPDLIDSLNNAYPDIPEEVIGDMSAALFNSSFALGSFLGPSCKYY